MKGFLSIFRRWGYRLERSRIDAVGPGGMEELSFFARLTQRTFRRKVKLEPPGKKFTVIMHSDIDPATGKLYKNFEERRRKLREASKESSCVGTYDNWKPNE